MGRPRADGARSFAGLQGVSQEVLDAIHAAFRLKRLGAGPTWAQLLADLKIRFGFDWNDSALSRYYAYWRSTLRVEAEAYEQAAAIVKQLAEHPTEDLMAAARQLLMQQRLLALSQMDETDPATVVALGQRQEQIDLAKDKLALDREKKAVSDEKLKLDQERLQLEREKQAAIDRPALFMEFWKAVVQRVASGDPEGSAAINRHFDEIMALIKAGAV